MLIIGGIGLCVVVGGFISARIQQKEVERKAALEWFVSMQVHAEQGSSEYQNNLAWRLAVAKDATLRDGKEAVKWATKACAATGYKDWQKIDTLAAAFAETGDFGQAVKYQQMALDQCNVPGALRTGVQDRLKLYQQGKPYRE